METLEVNGLQEAPTKEDVLAQVYKAVFDYLVASDATINVKNMIVNNSDIASNPTEAPVGGTISVKTKPKYPKQKRDKTFHAAHAAWTLEEDALLRVLWPLKNLSVAAIAKQMGRSIGAIRHRANAIKVTRR